MYVSNVADQGRQTKNRRLTTEKGAALDDKAAGVDFDAKVLNFRR